MKPIFGLLFVISCGATQLCPPSWSTFQEKCYYFSGIHTTTWDLVAQECRALHPGAAPVSIHSQAENDYLLSLMASTEYYFLYALIGLFRTGNTKHGLTNWQWMDGTELNFTNWAGTPTDDAFCVLLGSQESGNWSDNFWCEVPWYFFCQIEL